MGAGSVGLTDQELNDYSALDERLTSGGLSDAEMSRYEALDSRLTGGSAESVNEPSMLEQAWGGVRSGSLGLFDMVGGLAQFAGDKLQDPQTLLNGLNLIAGENATLSPWAAENVPAVGQQLSDFGRATSDRTALARQGIAQDVGAPPNRAYRAAETLTGMIPALATGPVGMGALFGLESAGRTYDDLVRQGIDPVTAGLGAAGSGGVSAAMGSAFGGLGKVASGPISQRILPTLFGNKLVQEGEAGLLRRMAETTLGGGLLSAYQSLLDTTMRDKITGTPATPEQLATTAREAFIDAQLPGVVFGAVGHAKARAVERAQRNAIDQQIENIFTESQAVPAEQAPAEPVVAAPSKGIEGLYQKQKELADLKKAQITQEAGVKVPEDIDQQRAQVEKDINQAKKWNQAETAIPETPATAEAVTPISEALPVETKQEPPAELPQLPPVTERELENAPRYDGTQGVPKPKEGETFLKGDVPLVKVPISEIGRDYKTFQIRTQTDSKGIVADKLKEMTGPYNNYDAGPFTIYEPLKENRGKYGMSPGQRFLVVDGHHRLGKAEADAYNGDVPTYVMREADGWTPREARIYAAEKNIKNKSVTVYDQAAYFRDLANRFGIDAAKKRASGLGARSRDAERIAFDATDGVFSAYANGILTEQQAKALVEVAPLRGEKAAGAVQERVLEEVAAKHEAGDDMPPDDIRASAAMKLLYVDEQGNVPTGKISQPDMFGGQTNQSVKQQEQNFKELLGKVDKTISFLRKLKDSPKLAQEYKDVGSIDLRNPVLRDQIINRIGAVKEVLSDPSTYKRELKAVLAAYNKNPEAKLFDTFSNFDIGNVAAFEEAVAGRPQMGQQTMFGPETGAVRIPTTVVDAIEHSRQTARKLYDNFLESDIGITRAPGSERFLQGKVGATKIPLLGSFRQNMIYFRTLAEKFSSVRPIYEGRRAQFEEKAAVAADLHERLQPYWKLQDRSRVDAFLAKDRMMAIGAVKNGTRPPPISEESMLRNGFTQPEVDAYRAVRGTMNRALDYIEEVLVADGRNKIKDPDTLQKYESDVQEYIDTLKMARYVPFSRMGFGYDVVGKDGKTMQLIAYNESGRQVFKEVYTNEADLNAAAIQQESLGRTTETKGVTRYRGFFDTKAEAKKAALEQKKKGYDVSITEMSERKRDAFDALPPEVGQNLREFNADKWTEMVKSGRPVGFAKHLARAGLIEGYDKTLSRGIADYTLGLGEFYSRKKYEQQIRDAWNQIPENETSLRSLVNQKLEKIERDRPRWEDGIINATNLWVLWGVPVSGITNLTQQLVTTMPEIGRYVKNPVTTVKIWTKAHKLALDYAQGKLQDKQLSRLIDYEYKHGNVAAQAFTELSQLRKGYEGKQTATDILAKTFTIPEKLNRLHALIAGWEVAKIVKPENPIKFAEDFSLNTQFDQSIVNRPLWMENPVGRMAGQYMNFLGNYIRFLRNRSTAKDWTAVAGSLGAIAGLGGVMGLPGIRDLTKLVEGLGVDIKQTLRRFLGNKDFANSILYGIPALFGWNISGNVGPGEYSQGLDNSPYEAIGRRVMGPFGDLALSRPWKGIDLIKRGETWKGVETMLPRFARGPSKALRSMIEGGLYDAYGNPIIEDPGVSDVVQMTLGATPQKAAEQYEIRNSRELLKAKNQSRFRYFSDQIKKSKLYNDQALYNQTLDEIAAYNAEQEEPANRYSLATHLPQINSDVRNMRSGMKGVSRKNRGEMRTILETFSE